MPPEGSAPWFVRFFYRQLYNRLAFAYDFISSLVSRGEWQAWTLAAIPFVDGPRVLEVASGTGNLLIALTRAGFSPIGVDLSPYMIQIGKTKLKAAGLPLVLVRARAQELPFPSEWVDSLVMSFPPGLGTDPAAMRELARVLKPSGKLVWIDAPYLYPRDFWSRLLNWAFGVASGAASSTQLERNQQANEFVPMLRDVLPRTGWLWQFERVDLSAGYVIVIIGTKERNIN